MHERQRHEFGKAAGLDLVSLTVNMPTFDATVRHIAAVLADIRTHAGTMTLIRSVGDVFEARETDKLGLTLNLQETTCWMEISS